MKAGKSRKKYGGSRGGDIAIFILLVLLGIFMLFPIYLSAVQSIKPSEELFLFPPKLYAMAPTNQNYVDLINTASNMSTIITPPVSSMKNSSASFPK